MNLANYITLIRIFLIPIIIFFIIIIFFENNSLYFFLNELLIIKGNNVSYSLPINYLIAGILFIIASLTDLLDGYVARKFNQVTTFGKFFDSIADKLLLNTVLIVFSYINIIPIWMSIFLIARDFVIDVVRQILALENIVMSANKLGRARAAVEMFGMTVLFFIGYRMFNGRLAQFGKWDEFGWINQIIMIPMYLATILSLISAISYIFLNKKTLFNMKIVKNNFYYKLNKKTIIKKNKNNQEWVIVTGSSRGLGYSYCRELLNFGYNLIAVSRDSSSVISLQKEYPFQQIKIFNFDLSYFKNCKKLFNLVKDYNISILINNAGYGVWGYFNNSSLKQEINMIDLNIKALHILTKIFMQKFIKQNKGLIINISSLAAFIPAPIFASYYASKSYVLSLGIAVNTELKKIKSSVKVITLCPGPLNTDFWNRSSNQKNAKYKSNIKTMKTALYARKSLIKALKAKRKNYIIIGTINKIIKFLLKLIPQILVLKFIYNYQKKRK